MKSKKISVFIVLILLFLALKSAKVLANSQAQSLSNGIYEIEWKTNENKVIDISAASIAIGANTQIWDKCNGGQQRFYITYLNDGYYQIKNVNSGRVLDVSGAGKEVGTNVQQWEWNSTDAQKWNLQKNSDGSFCIKSKCNGMYLVVHNSIDYNGANIEVSNKMQKFNFKKVTTVKGTQTIKDGTYKITTALNSGMALDISAASKATGANVQIWEYVNVPQQKFSVKYDGNGYYIIKNINSGKVLDVTGAKTERGTNVQQWDSNSTDAQKWVIKETSDGKYNIISKVSGINLEVANFKTSNGTNIHINMPTNADNQKFIFTEIKEEKTTFGIDVSHWQGTIDFNTLSKSNSVDFIIIRAGQGTTIKDRQFERNYQEAKKYNIPVGSYLYSTAQSVEETKKEANYLLSLLKGKNFELPIFYDVEAHESLSKETITAMCKEYCRILKNAGYKPGIYASKYYLLYKMYPEQLPQDCSIWVASYGKNDGNFPVDAYKYFGRHEIWQYTSKGRVAGIDGDVDLDVRYRIQ